MVDEVRANEILSVEDLEIRIDLGLGQESATYWTCDLSHEYISINAGESTSFLCNPPRELMDWGEQIIVRKREGKNK